MQLRQSLKFILASYVLCLLVVCGIFVLWLSEKDAKYVPWLFLLPAVLLIGTLVRHIQRRLTKLTISDDRLRFESGLFSKTTRTMELVKVQDVRVESIAGTRGAFRVALTSEVVEARRVLLCTGMIDEMVPLDGFRELWGRSIFQCPYCHGWEAQDRRWGFLALPATASHLLPFALQARGWTRDLVVFTSGAFVVPEDACAQMRAAGIRLETAPVARLVAREGRLEAVALANGTAVPCDVLFAHPPQRQVDLVRALGVALDDDGLVRVDPMKRETSVPGIYASGDLTTRMQAAIMAAASGVQAAAMLNVDLAMDL